MSKKGNEQLLHHRQIKKKAIILLSGEDEHAKAFHALLYALDLNEHGLEVKLYFDGEGTAWSRKLQEPDEKLRQYFDQAMEKGLIDTVCNYCAHAFKSIEQAKSLNVKLSSEGGHIPVGEMAREGYELITV